MSNRDLCVLCSKIIRNCHKNITCTVCKHYVHKKCTKLKPKELRKIDQWVCPKCINTPKEDDTDEPDSTTELNFTTDDIDFTKYDEN